MSKRQPTVPFAESQRREGSHDAHPVRVVGNDGTVRGRVGPSQDGVEETPASASVELRAAALMIPVRPCLSLSLER